MSNRETLLCRGNRHVPGERIAIAANVDYMIAVITADYLLNQSGYWEQAIIAGKRAGIAIGLVISKWDLVNDTVHNVIQEKLKDYERIGCDVFVCEPNNIPKMLEEKVKHNVSVVVGDRGCGKTTLIHLLIGEKTNRYASTNSTMMVYGTNDTIMIDTPGFKDFALDEITMEERDETFPEIAERAKNCAFRNCTHTHEDGCQVIDGVRTLNIRRERYQIYQQMSGNSSAMAKKKKEKEMDYRHNACMETFECQVCGKTIVPEGAGSAHRNHCPYCLSSIHVDETPGDRASLCKGVMDPVGIWVRKGGEWAIIHRCRECGTFSSNRVAADDNPIKLMSIAVKPLSNPPFPLDELEI